MAPAADALDDAKTRIAQAVDRLADDLERPSHQIHANPELAFKTSPWTRTTARPATARRTAAT